VSSPVVQILYGWPWPGPRAAAIIDAMKATTTNRSAIGSGGRRLVGLERHYRCPSCGGEQRSWRRISSCPECGELLAAARIRRAALA
jgi:hypothetical protein